MENIFWFMTFIGGALILFWAALFVLAMLVGIVWELGRRLFTGDWNA